MEEPRSKLRGIFDRKEFCLFFGSLANPAASDGKYARCCGSTASKKNAEQKTVRHNHEQIFFLVAK